jgi:hypothetical protein
MPIDELSKEARQSEYESLGMVGPYRCVKGYPLNRGVKNLGDDSADYHKIEEFAVPSVFLTTKQIAAMRHRGFVIDVSSKHPKKVLPAGIQDFHFELFGNPDIKSSTDSLDLAILEYQELWPPHEDPMYFTGSCHPTSADFINFALKKYGIDRMYEIAYDYGWDGHNLIAYLGDAIDWTIRQFRRCQKAPYPCIYSFPSRKSFNGVPNEEEMKKILEEGKCQ